MRETTFIEQNEQKWQEFERILDGERSDPGKLNDLFIQVTDDLSFARTFYPNRSVRVYLNGLAQRVFFKIYKGKKSKRSRLVEFWANELPLLLFQSRKDLLLSLVLFAVAMAIGMLSCYADPDFLEIILGADYVEMTKANIESGDPMAVYKERGETNMFLGITLNNILVALRTFLFGVFYAIGTLGILLYNGIMLGAFQFFFIEQGLFRESFLTVWMHGAFEISSIVIAGAAGITMGRGLVFPGTLSRIRSFQLSARRGLSIMVGTVPLFIIAGFIESFLTRYTDVPDVVRGMFILLCFGLVIFYFVIFPAMQVRRGMVKLGKDFGLTPDLQREINLAEAKTTGELFTDAFVFFRKKLRPIALTALAGAGLFTTGAFLLADTGVMDLFQFDGGLFSIFSNLPQFFVNPYNPFLFVFNVLTMSMVAYLVHRLIEGFGRSQNGTDTGKTGLETALGFSKILVIVLLLNLVFIINNGLAVLLWMLVFPSLFLWGQVMISEGSGMVGGLSRSFALTKGTFGQMFGLFLTTALVGLLFFLILDTGILQFLLFSVSMNFFMSEAQGEILTTVLTVLISMFVLLLVFAFLVTAMGLQYFSNLEVNEANSLQKKIEGIQARKAIRGLEREG